MSTSERTIHPLLPVEKRNFSMGFYYHSSHDRSPEGLKWFQVLKQFLEKSAGQTIIQVSTEGPHGVRVLLEPAYMSDASASAAADKLIAWLPYDGEDRTERFMQLYGLTEDQFKGNLQNETPGTEAPRASTENPFPVANCEKRLSEPEALSSSADKNRQKLRPLVVKTIGTVDLVELAMGWLRYQALRSVAEPNFDERVDMLLVEREGL